MADRFAAARAACEDRLQRWRHGTWPQRRLSGGNSVGRVRPNEKRLVNEYVLNCMDSIELKRTFSVRFVSGP